MRESTDTEIFAIGELIERETCFNVIDITWNVQRRKNYFQVEDKTTEDEFTLLVFSLDNGDGKICPKRLSQIKKRSEILQECQHENVMKYYGEFQLKQYYFIQIEKYGIPLQRWKFEYQDFTYYKILLTKIALQLSQLIQFLNGKKYELKVLSLENICVDEFHQVKVWNIQTRAEYITTIFFDEGKNIESLQNKSQFMPIDKVLCQQLQSDKAFKKNQMNQIPDIYALGNLMFQLLEQQSQENKYTCRMHKAIFQTGHHFEIIRSIFGLGVLKFQTPKNLIEEYSCMLQKQLISLDEISLFKQAKHEIRSGDSKNDELSRFNKDNLLLCHQKHPSNPNYLFCASIAFQQNSQINNSLKCLDKWKRLFPILTDKQEQQYEKLLAILTKAQIYQQNEMKTYQNLAKLEPSNFKAISRLIQIAYLNQQKDKALSIFHYYQKYYPNQLDCHGLISHIYQSRGCQQLAIEICQERLLTNPYDFGCLQDLSNYYQSRGNFKQAIKYIDKLVYLTKDKTNFFLLQASYLYQLDDNLEKAILCLKKAVSLEPDNFHELENLSLLYYRNQQYIQSIKCLEACEKLNNTRFMTCLADRYFTLQLYDKAKQRYLRYIDNQIQVHESYLNVGLIYMEQGNYKKAKFAFKQGIHKNLSQSDNYSFCESNTYQLRQQCYLYLSNVHYHNKNYYHAHISLLKYANKNFKKQSKNILKMNHAMIMNKLKMKYGISTSEAIAFTHTHPNYGKTTINFYPSINTIEANQQNIFNEGFMSDNDSDDESQENNEQEQSQVSEDDNIQSFDGEEEEEQKQNNQTNNIMQPKVDYSLPVDQPHFNQQKENKAIVYYEILSNSDLNDNIEPNQVDNSQIQQFEPMPSLILQNENNLQGQNKQAGYRFIKYFPEIIEIKSDSCIQSSNQIEQEQNQLNLQENQIINLETESINLDNQNDNLATHLSIQEQIEDFDQKSKLNQIKQGCQDDKIDLIAIQLTNASQQLQTKQTGEFSECLQAVASSLFQDNQQTLHSSIESHSHAQQNQSIDENDFGESIYLLSTNQNSQYEPDLFESHNNHYENIILNANDQLIPMQQTQLAQVIEQEQGEIIEEEGHDDDQVSQHHLSDSEYIDEGDNEQDDDDDSYSSSDLGSGEEKELESDIFHAGIDHNLNFSVPLNISFDVQDNKLYPNEDYLSQFISSASEISENQSDSIEEESNSYLYDDQNYTIELTNDSESFIDNTDDDDSIECEYLFWYF